MYNQVLRTTASRYAQASKLHSVEHCHIHIARFSVQCFEHIQSQHVNAINLCSLDSTVLNTRPVLSLSLKLPTCPMRISPRSQDKVHVQPGVETILGSLLERECFPVELFPPALASKLGAIELKRAYLFVNWSGTMTKAKSRHFPLGESIAHGASRIPMS
jgi:hypothetical protein